MITKRKITLLARELRRKSTPEEVRLWHVLRKKQVNGYKFLRQHSIIYARSFEGNLLFFIADFYCAQLKLVVELDGKIHDFQKDYDQNRDMILREMGLKVLRIKNDEMEEIEKVVSRIKEMTHP